MSAPARALDDGGERRTSWSGAGRLTDAADVARVVAELNATGRVRGRTDQLRRVVTRAADVVPAHLDATRTLPVVDELSTVLPWRGLRRGATVGAVGSTSLLLTLLGGAMSAGGHAAVVGMPTFGAWAAAEYTVPLERLALVPTPGPDWPAVVAALLDGLDVVVVHAPGTVAAAVARRLAARARQRGAVLLTTQPWPEADLTLQSTTHRWRGIGQGRGRLVLHETTIVARGRGAAARPHETTLALPPPSLRARTGAREVPMQIIEAMEAPIVAAAAPRPLTPVRPAPLRAAPDPWAEVARSGTPAGEPGPSPTPNRKPDRCMAAAEDASTGNRPGRRSTSHGAGADTTRGNRG